MLVMAATLLFSLNSCDKDDDDDNGGNGKWTHTYTEYGTTYSVTDLKDDGKCLSYSMKMENGGDWCIETNSFTYEKGIITGCTEVYECSSDEVADAMYSELLEDDEYSSVVKSGKKITAIYKSTVFDGSTVSDVQKYYNYEIEEDSNGGYNTPSGPSSALTKDNYIEYLKDNSGLVLTPTSTMSITHAIDYGTYSYFVSFSTENAIADAEKIGKDLFGQTAKLGDGNYYTEYDYDDETGHFFWTEKKPFSSFEDSYFMGIGDFKEYWWYYDTQSRSRLQVYIEVDGENNYVSIGIDF